MAEPIVPPYLSPPAELHPHRRDLTKAEAQYSVHSELGLRWYHNAAPARDVARRLTGDTGELHFVVALDYGTLRWASGSVRREAVTGADGTPIGSKMFLPFTYDTLAAYIDAVRLSPAYGPSCLNLYEECNIDRPRRVGFDLEFELEYERKNGERDHEQRAAKLWPADFRAVACTPELFLRRILVDRVLPALNEMTGTQVSTRDMYLMDSSSQGKLSFHVATPLVLATADDVSIFSRWMRATFENCHEPLAPLLDCGVYATRGNMRLPLNRKPAKAGAAADKPWLRPVSRVGSLDFAATHDAATPSDPHGYTLALLRQHTWSCVEPDYERISERLNAWSGAGCSRERAGPTGCCRKRYRDSEVSPDTPEADTDGKATRSPPRTRESDEMTAHQFEKRFGITFGECLAYQRSLQATAGGTCSAKVPALPEDSVNHVLYWHTCKEHTCVHGNSHASDNFMTKVSGDLVLRGCHASECKSQNGKMDWRIIGMLGARTDRWCSAERPPAEELQPWPLPRHWYFYEPLCRRKLGQDVRCVAAKAVRAFDATSSRRDGIFHRFLVEYTDERGHVVCEELGLSLHFGRLFRSAGPSTCMPTLNHAYKPEIDGEAVSEQERLAWWFETTWRHDLERLEARRGDPEYAEPPHSWIIPARCSPFEWYPWLELNRLDALIGRRHSRMRNEVM
jgi:hypothetical protein